VSEEQLNQAVKAIERKGAKAVSQHPVPSGPAMNGDAGPGDIGTSLAKPAGHQRGGSQIVSPIPGAEDLGNSTNADDGDEA
jgi:hypothetical protein